MTDITTIYVAQGQALAIDLGSHQILIRNHILGEPLFVDCEEIHSGEIINCLTYHDSTTTRMEDPLLTDTPPLIAGKNFTITAPTLPYVPASMTGTMTQVGLDALLAASVVQGPTAAEEILRSSSSPPAPTPPPPPAMPQTVSSAPQPGHETIAPPRPAPVGLAEMHDAPKDGKVIMVDNGAEQQPAKWSSALGRQFWVTPDNDSLGMDDDFRGWRHATEADKEEFGL